MAIEKIFAGNELNFSQAGSLKNQKVKKKHDYNFIGYALAGAAMLGVLGYFTFKEPVLNSIREIKLKQAYTRALSQYGDSDGDGFVSAEENRDFYNNILYQNNAQRNPNPRGFPIKDNKEISAEEFTKMIQAYKPYNRFEE